MTDIIWDETGKRLFEIGLDQGVLYLDDNHTVPWNGLVSIEEVFEENQTTTYLDGLKILNKYALGDFKAIITAFTYPDDFLPYQGIESYDDSGLMVTGQKIFSFGLSYRTLIGNDILGSDYGYQIHLLYNLIAVPQDIEYNSYSNNINIIDFSWSVTGTPEYGHEFYPTAHVIFDSRFASKIPYLLDYVHDVLYGTSELSDEENLAVLPPLKNLIFLVTNFEALTIVINETTGLSSFVPGYGDVTRTTVDGVLAKLPRSRFVLNTDGFYAISE